MKPLKALIGMLCLVACVEGNGQGFTEGFNKGFNEGVSQDWLTGNTYAQGSRFKIGPVDPQYPRANVTYATSDFFHGLQVEYFGPGGRAYLWYPGNERAVTGEWTAEGNELCFRYQANSYNPVTGQSGGQWECRNRTGALGGLISFVEGDAFGLKSGLVPAHDLRTCKLPGDMKLMVSQMKCLPKG